MFSFTSIFITYHYFFTSSWLDFVKAKIRYIAQKWELSADGFPLNSIRKGRVYTLIPDDGLDPSTFVLRKFYPSFCLLIQISFRRVPVCPGRWCIDILFLSPIDIAWSFWKPVTKSCSSYP
jgi:hypothetical protein